MKSTSAPSSKSGFKKRLPFVVIVLALVGGGAVAYAYTRPNTTVVTPQVGQAPVSPDPGQPGNPGDDAKSQIDAESQKQSEGTTTPTASPAGTGAATASNVKVSDLVITPQPDGQVYVNSAVTGATSGSCALSLTSPSGAKSSFTGAVEFDGRNYFCSYQRVDGITEAGTWLAALTVTQGSSTSAAATAQFKK